MNTPEQASENKVAGMASSEEHSGQAWHKYACGFVREYCRTHRTVFVDDLWTEGLIEPVSLRALGSVMTHALKEGWIVQMNHNGYICSRPSVRSNGQLKAVWISKIFD